MPMSSTAKGGFSGDDLIVNPLYWGLGAMFATLMTFSPSVSVFQKMSGLDTTFPRFALLSLATAFVAAVLTLVPIHYPQRLRRAMPMLGGILYLVGNAGLLYLLMTPEAGDTPMAVVLGIACGAGSLDICVLWVQCYSHLNLRSIILNVAISCALYAGYLFLSARCGTVPQVVLFLVLSVISFLVPCLHGSLRELAAKPTHTPALKAGVHDLKNLLLSPLLGVVVFAFVMGFRRGGIDSGENVQMVVGFLLACVVSAPIVFMSYRRPVITFIYRIFLPSLAVLAVLVSYLLTLLGFRPVSVTAMYFFFEVLLVFSLSVLAALAHNRELGVVQLAALVEGLYALLSFIGLLMVVEVFPQAEEAGDIVFICVSVAYFAFIAIYPAMSDWRRNERVEDAPGEDGWVDDGLGDPTLFGGDKGGSHVREESGFKADAHGDDGRDDAAGVATEEDRFTEQCRKVTESYSLTPREGEILSIIARGHGAVYVSQVLLISESTARTHVRNIYHKLDICSREELLVLVDGALGAHQDLRQPLQQVQQRS